MVEAESRSDKRTVLPRTRRATFGLESCAILGGVSAINEELGACIRSWRDRVLPAEAGLPSGSARRVPGLRREEVARLAGLSLDYLARLEQGRAAHPSPSVLASLARALRLSDEERAHLFRLAGLAEPSTGTMNRHIGPGVQRLLDRLGDVPVMVLDASWQVIALNPLAGALFGDLSDAGTRERNIAWRRFSARETRVVRGDADTAVGAGRRSTIRRSVR
jgi:transcriptional regulator with XRE-family HTH domain